MSVVVIITIFLIEVYLGIFLNLISTELEQWYSQNRSLVVALTALLVVLGAILSTISFRFSDTKETQIMPNDTTTILQVLFEEYNKAPGEKVHFELIRKKIDVPEEDLIFHLKKLEERGFVQATWVGRKALLSITEDGIALLRGAM
jgi:hypothetical protein